MSNKSLVIRIIAAVLLLGLIIAGGFVAYKAGMVQGVSQAPSVATAISEAAKNGQVAPLPPMMYGHGYGYGYPMMYGPHFGFFPFGMICGSILFVLLIFGLFRILFFRPWHHGGHMHGPWGRNWENGVPPMFDQWHKQVHGEAAPTDSDPAKKDS